MIDIHIQAASADEALSELSTLSGMAPAAMTEEQYALLCARSLEANKKVDAADEEIDKLMDEVADLKNELAGKEQRIAELENDLTSEHAKNRALTAQLAAVEKAKPIHGQPACEDEEYMTPPETPDPNQIEAYPETEEASEEPAAESEEPAEEVKEYKKEDVRAVLVKAREKGINIADILSNYGGTLGAVKEKEYPALVDDVQTAISAKEEK